MERYIVIVRDYDVGTPSDEYLRALDMYYQSPIVELDFLKNRDKAIDDFERRFGKNFDFFLHKRYELIPIKK